MTTRYLQYSQNYMILNLKYSIHILNIIKFNQYGFNILRLWNWYKSNHFIDKCLKKEKRSYEMQIGYLLEICLRCQTYKSYKTWKCISILNVSIMVLHIFCLFVFKSIIFCNSLTELLYFVYIIPENCHPNTSLYKCIQCILDLFVMNSFECLTCQYLVLNHIENISQNM